MVEVEKYLLNATRRSKPGLLEDPPTQNLTQPNWLRCVRPKVVDMDRQFVAVRAVGVQAAQTNWIESLSQNQDMASGVVLCRIWINHTNS